MGLERGKEEVQQEEEEAVKEMTAPPSSSELQEFEAELQATLSALEQEPTRTPDEDKVLTPTWCHASIKYVHIHSSGDVSSGDVYTHSRKVMSPETCFEDHKSLILINKLPHFVTRSPIHNSFL